MSAVLGFGFLLGLRHALDVDHLAAVSTIVSQRRGLWRSALVGAVWGLGHTAALLAVAVVLIALRAEIPPSVARLLELAVACMLIGLGVDLLRTLQRGETVPAQVDAGARRPFLIGLLHGLAGSAGVMLAVLATITDPIDAIAYVALFGVGSIGGMVMTSTVLGLPLALAAARFDRAEVALRTAAAVGSVVVGVVLAWQIGTDAGVLGTTA